MRVKGLLAQSKNCYIFDVLFILQATYSIEWSDSLIEPKNLHMLEVVSWSSFLSLFSFLFKQVVHKNQQQIWFFHSDVINMLKNQTSYWQTKKEELILSNTPAFLSLPIQLGHNRLDNFKIMNHATCILNIRILKSLIFRCFWVIKSLLLRSLLYISRSRVYFL